MPTITITSQAKIHILAIASNFYDTSHLLPDGNWQFLVKQSTLDRIKEASFPGESLSDTITRVAVRYLTSANSAPPNGPNPLNPQEKSMTLDQFKTKYGSDGYGLRSQIIEYMAKAPPFPGCGALITSIHQGLGELQVALHNAPALRPSAPPNRPPVDIDELLSAVSAYQSACYTASTNRQWSKLNDARAALRMWIEDHRLNVSFP